MSFINHAWWQTASTALIETENPQAEELLFSWQKTATQGSSFCGIEKKLFAEDLQGKAGIASHKKSHSFQNGFLFI